MITRKYPPRIGGMEVLSYQLTQEMARRGPVRLITWGRSQRLLPFFFASALLRLCAGLLLGRISVLHLGDPVLAPLGWLAKRFGVPVAVTVHGLDVTFPHRVYQALLKTFALGFDAYVCISREAQEQAVARGVPQEKLHVIPVGVSAPALTPEELRWAWAQTGLQIPATAPVILTVGRLVPRKGVAWFVEEVCPRLIAHDPSIHYVIAGQGPDHQRIHAAVVRHGLSDHVHVVGQVTESQKWALYHRCQICAMPNVSVPGDIEGFGIVALEAGIVGKPVLAADLDGLRDAVTHEVNGLLLPPQDAGAWVTALQPLLRDADRRIRLGTGARAFVIRLFSWSRICDQYQSIFAAIATEQASCTRPHTP